MTDRPVKLFSQRGAAQFLADSPYDGAATRGSSGPAACRRRIKPTPGSTVWVIGLLLVISGGPPFFPSSGALQQSMKAARSPASPFEFRPGVIVDPNQPAVYLMNPRGGIDAVDLTSGKVRWTTTQAAKPLLVHGNLLIAQAEDPTRSGILPIVGLNTAQGGKLVFKADVKLPDDVSPAIDESLGTSFQATAHMRKRQFIVSWRFSQHPVSGVAPRPDEKPRGTQAAGAAWIDPATGRARPVNSDQIPAPFRAGLPDDVARLRSSGAVPAGFTIQFASADNQHILASKPISTGRTAQEKFIWLIFSSKTGTRVSELRHPQSAAPFFLWGSRLIYEGAPPDRPAGGKTIEEPLALRAIDIKTSTELWSHPIRDTTYRGPYPPAAPDQ